VSISATPVAAAPVTVTELQAALRAAWAGQFRAGSMQGPTRMRTPNGQPGAVLSGRLVMVVGCHGGAGASTVALSVAERSGLLTAVDAELGVEPGGWRRGRRAQLPIYRVAEVLVSAVDVPTPADDCLGQVEVTVVDSGWGATGVLSGDSWLAEASSSAALVLVARATIPALRQLEQVLATCPPGPVVTVQGPSRWNRSVHASAGPLEPRSL